MDQAFGLFTKVFFTLIQRWSDTCGFRRIVELGLLHAVEAAAVDNLRAAEWFLTDLAHEKFFLDKAKFLESSGWVQVVGTTMTENQLAAFGASVDAASLVFMHSALDGAAFDLCKVTTMVAPFDWEQFLGEQKVSLLDVKSAVYENLFRSKLADHLKVLERESLLKKVDRLFQLCKPPSGFAPILGYQFNRDRVQALDQIRHDIIHGDAAGKLLADMEGSIKFLLNTGLFLLGLVNHRYDVRLDPDYFIKTTFSRAAAADAER